MVKYYYKIDNANNETDFTQLIRVGSRTLEFRFQWAIVSEEQFDIVVRYLRQKANTDPILRRNGNYDREYNWYVYYMNLVGLDLNEWLDSGPELPASIVHKPRNKQLALLKSFIKEVRTLQPAVLLYADVLKWGFKMTCDDLPTTVGNVQPGGWYHNQSDKLSFRFTSKLDNIDKESISQVVIEFEVYDE